MIDWIIEKFKKLMLLCSFFAVFIMGTIFGWQLREWQGDCDKKNETKVEKNVNKIKGQRTERR